MKVFWKEPQRVLQMEAENAVELVVIAELLHGGLLAGATWLRVREEALSFSREPGEGITSLTGGPHVVVGLLWDVDPMSPRKKLLDAQQATGQAVHQLVRLLARQVELDFAQSAAGVSAI
jgi:hypothetical protein